MTKTKFKRRSVSLLLSMVLLIVSIMAPSGTIGSAETLIQRESETGTRVDGSSTTDFSIAVNRKDDEFNVYKIAEMNWDESANEGKGSFSQAAWVEPVNTWIASSAYSKYDTPEKLAAESESLTIAMLKELRKAMNEDSSLSTSMDSYKIAYHTGNTPTKGNSSNVTAATSSADGDETGDFLNSYTVSGIEFGIYFVDAQNTKAARTYQPILANVTPKQTGPSGNWYFGDKVSVTLKYQDVVINKYINKTADDADKKTDTVRKGEKVSFEIDTQIPQYPSDSKSHTLYLSDNMAGGFTLDESTLQLKYSTDDGASWSDLASEDYYTLNVLKDAFIYNVTPTGKDTTAYAFAVSNGTNYTYYTLKDGELLSLGNYTDDSSAWSQVLTAYNNKMGTSLSGTIEKSKNKKSVIHYNFKYDKLMEDLNVTDMKLTYKATVNDEMNVGKDNNTNRIALNYVEDSTGKTNEVTDVVKAWTYAVNIVKVDGDTVKKDAPTYLAKAEFDLYRRSDTYCSETSGAGTEESDYSSYKWYSNQDGKKDAVAAEMSETLDGVTGNGIYKIPVKIESCNKNGGEHYHIEVFKKINKDAIVSVADKNGITYEGLDPNAYILVETKAPDGYNLLSEAVRFEINQYDKDKYEAAGDSYKGFIGDDKEDRTDGIYPIQVMNFKGAVLPSTGGMGTWLFIIIGISVMLGAMVCVMISRKRHSANEY